MDLPDASIQVLLGFAFVLVLASESLRGRLFPLTWLPRRASPSGVAQAA
jgi:simple sugar transport system permease protein